MNPYSDVLEEATEIVERASRIALSYFRQALLIETKADHSPVTIADKKTEEAIRTDLTRAFPDHGIVGEEFGEAFPDREFVWTIDPIDGTRSFVRGIPLFGTLVALLERGEPVLGIAVLPALDETYVAAKGLGAYCDGHLLRVANTQSLDQALVCSGDTPAFESAGKLPYQQELFRRSGLVRGYSDCFGHLMVVRGAVDAMVDPLVSIWDIAPLISLITEAGGTYFDFEGNSSLNSKSFLTCNPALKSALLQLK
jgi:histidinol phosphatase-like enzyme (inositol monophosphatase family)